MSQKPNERQDRINKLEELKARGINPYPAVSRRDLLVRSVLNDFDKLLDEGKNFFVAGRLRSLRLHGNIAFADLEDRSGRLQIVFNKQELDDDYNVFKKYIDVADFIQVKGECFVTKAGEKSILAKDWKLLTKTIRPLPEEHFGLKNEEERLRKRYLDILLNSEVKEMVIKRGKFWNAVREFLMDKGFLEVETPVLENTPGGADAKPFITHHNALDMDVFLRISTGELWQKKLMVAGLEKTFEIGRQFRNEGIDPEHAQDYTQMEFYWAYADYEKGMELVEELYKFVAKKTFGTLKFKINNFEVDLGAEWQRYDYRQTVLEKTGIDILKADLPEMEAKLKELGVEYDTKGFNITRAIDNLWKYCRKQLAGPGFLVGVPVTVSPLAKRDDNNPKLAQRFQPIIAGSELGNGYSELNDPIDQAERFNEQQKLREAGDEEAQMKDEEFVEALEHGMPPTCGFGMSERVFSYLMNKSLRESQIFPLLKPRGGQKSAKKEEGSKEGSDQGGDRPETEADPEHDPGISYEEAEKILDKYISDETTKKHSLATAAIMRELAAVRGKNPDEWATIGLLHDIDWQATREEPEKHCVKAIDILKKEGASQYLINIIISHCYGNDEVPAYADKERESDLEHLLAAAETLTGLIVATALVRPDKKLEQVELKSLKKKFKSSNFAANCNRDIIKEAEMAGMELDDFLSIGLEAMKKINNQLGL